MPASTTSATKTATKGEKKKGPFKKKKIQLKEKAPINRFDNDYQPGPKKIKQKKKKTFEIAKKPKEEVDDIFSIEAPPKKKEDKIEQDEKKEEKSKNNNDAANVEGLTNKELKRLQKGRKKKIFSEKKEDLIGIAKSIVEKEEERIHDKLSKEESKEQWKKEKKKQKREKAQHRNEIKNQLLTDQIEKLHKPIKKIKTEDNTSKETAPKKSVRFSPAEPKIFTFPDFSSKRRNGGVNENPKAPQPKEDSEKETTDKKIKPPSFLLKKFNKKKKM